MLQAKTEFELLDKVDSRLTQAFLAIPFYHPLPPDIRELRDAILDAKSALSKHKQALIGKEKARDEMV